jgi:hypothetical protein
VGSFVPCSPRHHHCSPAHAALVAGYRLARYDEEIRHEAILSNPGDKKIWKENGGKLINFKDWLIGNKRSHNDKVEEEEWKNECLQKRFAEGVSNRVENDQESSAHLDSKTVGYNGIEREPVGTREQFRLHSRRPVPMAFSSISASTWNQLQE